MKVIEFRITDPQLRIAADAATRQLDGIIGRSAGSVSAAWMQAQDPNGRTFLKLEIADSFGEASALFWPMDFQRPDRMHEKLYVLWGDLLQRQTSTLVQRLQDSVGIQG